MYVYNNETLPTRFDKIVPAWLLHTEMHERASFARIIAMLQ